LSTSTLAEDLAEVKLYDVTGKLVSFLKYDASGNDIQLEFPRQCSECFIQVHIKNGLTLISF